jgi:transmembrane sensor
VQQDDPRSLPTTSSSEEALLWIVRLHSGSATAADRQEFHLWRAKSIENEMAAQEAETLWSDASELHQDARTGAVRPGRQLARKPSRRVTIIGGLVAAAGGGLLAAGTLRKPASDFATGLGETRGVMLPDGSKVTLNARSAVRLQFSAAARRVELVDGQAYFEVASDTARPFEVVADDIVTTALGTAFDVNRNLAEGGAAVSVTQHAVRIRIDGTAAASLPRRSIDLREGQSVTVAADGRIGAVATGSPASAVAWRRGQYVAENRSLADVVAALQSYHEGWLVLRGEAGKLRVNAVLDLKTPDESLDALASGLPISVRRLSRFLVVISSA